MQVCFNCQELAQTGQLEEEGREQCLGPAYCVSSLLGAPDVKADAIVGVGDGAKDGLVPLAAQAPFTGTPVVNPIDGLQREGGITESQTAGACWLSFVPCLAVNCIPGTSQCVPDSLTRGPGIRPPPTLLLT